MADEFKIEVSPLGEVLVRGRSVYTFEAGDKIVEDVFVGQFYQGSPLLPGGLEVVGPGVWVRSETDL